MTPPTLHPLSALCERLHLTEQTMRRFLRSIGFEAVQGGQGPLFTDEYIVVIEGSTQMPLSLIARKGSEMTGTSAAEPEALLSSDNYGHCKQEIAEAIRIKTEARLLEEIGPRTFEEPR